MIRASAGRRTRFSGQALPLEKYAGAGHDGLLIVKVDIRVCFGEGAADKKVHRSAAEQAPAPGIFVIQGALDPVMVVLLRFAVNLNFLGRSKHQTALSQAPLF
jgi:hypothetical protein